MKLLAPVSISELEELIQKFIPEHKSGRTRFLTELLNNYIVQRIEETE